MNTQENNKMIAEFMGYELIGNTYSKKNGMDWFIEPHLWTGGGRARSG